MAIKLSCSKKIEGKYNAEDMAPHDTVAAIFSKGTGEDCRYLSESHVKHKMVCPVIGKVKHDQSITEALIAECKEEANLKPLEYKEILSYKRFYDFTGKKIPVTTHVFKVIKYTGALKNNEPKKHKWIKWLTRKEIENIKDLKLADVYAFYFKWLDDQNTADLTKPHVKVGG